jgi:transposase-like protein
MCPLRGVVPAQRCTVHKHRNLLAHAPERLHEELSADYTDMIYAAATPQEVEARRKAFLRKWRLKCRAVADSLEEAGERLFAFTRLPPGQWKSARTTNAVERLHEGAKHCFAQAPDQDPDRAAQRRDRGDAVLGPARLGPDHHAQGRWLAEPRSGAVRQRD